MKKAFLSLFLLAFAASAMGQTILSSAAANQTSAAIDSTCKAQMFVFAKNTGAALSAGTLATEISIDNSTYDAATNPVAMTYAEMNAGTLKLTTTCAPFSRFKLASFAFTYGKTQTTGTGLSDLTMGGTYSALVNHTYKIKIAVEDAAAVAASATLTSTGVAPADGDTVVLGVRTYTFRTALTAPETAWEVLIGVSAATALDNLKSAVNATAGGGTTYGSDTAENATISATTNTDTTQLFVADTAGGSGNALVSTTPVGALLSFGAATFAGGIDAIVSDFFSWNKDGGAYSAPVAIDTTAQTVADGITVTFAAAIGHTLADEWTVTTPNVTVKYLAR